MDQYGNYVGINLTALVNGESFEESKASFCLNKDFLQIKGDFGLSADCFPASMVLELDDSENCIAIRQDSKSNLAEAIFDFSKFSFEGINIDAVMILGEGMPVPLGLFIGGDGENLEEVLLELYNILKLTYNK